MALAEAVAAIHSPSCRSGCFYSCSTFLVPRSISRFIPRRTFSGAGVSNVLIGFHFTKRGARLRRWRSNVASTTRVLENPQEARATVELPLTCYQLLGILDKAEKDEIVKSVMLLKRAEVEDGYTMDVVKSREDLLMDLRDKLLFEPEYAGNIKEKIPPKSQLRIPWAWLPGALCLLQEVGEEKLVLDIGRAALQHPEARPYVHDILLSMALAECAIAKSSFEKNKVSQGFEALARAQCLLRSKNSLGKMALLSQIEESLEELAPACTLELLGIPHSPENAERRRGAIAALRELLSQGLAVESSCRVQEWPCFLNQALLRLMATEIVDLVPWDSLAQTRKNKKAIESQNQRVVIEFNCFYVALLAHIALGFSSKQRELINKAKVICECLIASEGIDLKFEEAFCLYLLGQVNEAEAAEKLKLLDMKYNSSLQKSVLGKEPKDATANNLSLESWLKDMVLSAFPDTQDSSPSLVDFFNGEKKAFESKKNRAALQKTLSMNHRPLSTALRSDRRKFEETLPNKNSSQRLGSAVKQLTVLQSPDIKSRSGSNDGAQSIQMERKLVSHNSTIWGLLPKKDIVGRVTFVAILGCIAFTISLLSKKFHRGKGGDTRWTYGIHSVSRSSVVSDCFPDYKGGHDSVSGNDIEGVAKKVLATVRGKFGNLADAENMRKPSLAASSISSSVVAVHRKHMPMEVAEALVKQWQAIKAEALGPSHHVHCLPDILDESMLDQWYALADTAKRKSCHWRFVLLQLSILRAEIVSDVSGKEMAEVEALLDEAAELVDESLPKNPNYYSSYKIHYVLKRQEDGSWKFCKGDIQSPL